MGSAKVKKRLDARMLLNVASFSSSSGRIPSKVSALTFVNHDLRRKLRTGLSKLRIDFDIREAVLAHTRPRRQGRL